MEVHIPTEMTSRSLSDIIRNITYNLDAVVINHDRSTLYPEHVWLNIVGNPRDLAICATRASEIGGKVD